MLGLTPLPHSRRIRAMPSLPARSRIVSSLLLRLGLLACGLAGASGARADAALIYRWTDEQGIAHYTAHLDRVPRAVRGSVQAVSATPATTNADDSWAATDARGPAPRTFDEGPLGSGARAASGTTGAAAEARRTASAEPAPSGASARDVSALDERIAALQREVDRDQDAIRVLLSETPAAGATALHERPEMREIAQRLPRLQADLRALREQRGRIDRSR